MRLTITLDPVRAGTVTVRVEHALAYPAGDVARRIADAVARELGHHRDAPVPAGDAPPGSREGQRADIEAPEWFAQESPPAALGRRETDDDPCGDDQGRVRAARWRALQLLDRDGLTVEQAAARVGVAAELVARWDDDAATDAEHDQFVDPHEWARRGRAS